MSEDDEAVAEVLALARTTCGVDFSAYRPTTVRRRAEHRMRMRGCESLRAYAELVARDVAERWPLVDALLVKTTRAFRDPEVWSLLREGLLEDLVARCAGRGSTQLRAWVAGTSTGEEAWTVAMCLVEARERAAADVDVRVIATDVDPIALERTARGALTAEAARDVPAELRDRFLDRRGDRLVVSSELQSVVATERHDLLGDADAPSSCVLRSFDLVTCRNVLLYFDEAPRQRAFARLVSACEPGGLFLLGESEAAPESSPRQLVRVAGRVYRVE